MPVTPIRSIRVPDDVWKPAQERAAQMGVPLGRLITDFLRSVIAPEPAVQPLRSLTPRQRHREAAKRLKPRVAPDPPKALTPEECKEQGHRPKEIPGMGTWCAGCGVRLS